MNFYMRNTTFISSVVLSVACVSAANAAVAFDSFTVVQSQMADGIDAGVNWASPSSSQSIFGASGMRSAFAYNNPGPNPGPSSVSVSAGTATFDTTGIAGLFYSGNAQDLTGYTFSFHLIMTNMDLFEVYFGIAGGTYAQYIISYTGSGTYTVDLSTVPDNGAFSFTAITNISIALTAQTSAVGPTRMSNFTYTPAPGAVTLLGAAGLIGARRRRA